MKKTFLLLSTVILSMILFSCCKDDQEQVSLFYKEVIYDFSDGVDYFTATLASCSGVKDINDPSKGTIYATINIKANRLCNLKFSSIEGLIDLSLIHISEPTRLLSISYAVFCLKKKKKKPQHQKTE